MLGGSQFHGGWEGRGEKKKKGRGGQLYSAHPSGTVLPRKRAQSWEGRGGESRGGVGGLNVDYKGGASCRRADVWVCGRGRGTRWALGFTSALNRRLHRRRPRRRPRGPAFSSPLCRFLLLKRKKATSKHKHHPHATSGFHLHLLPSDPHSLRQVFTVYDCFR